MRKSRWWPDGDLAASRGQATPLPNHRLTHHPARYPAGARAGYPWYGLPRGADHRSLWIRDRWSLRHGPSRSGPRDPGLVRPPRQASSQVARSQRAAPRCRPNPATRRPSAATDACHGVSKISTQAFRRRGICSSVKRQLLDEEDVGEVAGPLVRTLVAQVLRTGVELLGHLVANGQERNRLCLSELNGRERHGRREHLEPVERVALDGRKLHRHGHEVLLLVQELHPEADRRHGEAGTHDRLTLGRPAGEPTPAPPHPFVDQADRLDSPRLDKRRQGRSMPGPENRT